MGKKEEEGVGEAPGDGALAGSGEEEEEEEGFPRRCHLLLLALTPPPRPAPLRPALPPAGVFRAVGRVGRD